MGGYRIIASLRGAEPNAHLALPPCARKGAASADLAKLEQRVISQRNFLSCPRVIVAIEVTGGRNDAGLAAPMG